MSEVPSQARLQRAPDITGGRLVSFRQIVIRHGLPFALIGLLLLLHPDLRRLLLDNLSGAHSKLYLVWGVAIMAGLSLYAVWIDKGWRPMQLGWVVYLGALSLWEEWVFRLALPSLFESAGLTVGVAILVANLLFGAVHYFTLRWKWPWCVGVFLGGLALSRQIEIHSDLFLITAYHWIGTLLNTPRSPGSRNSQVLD